MIARLRAALRLEAGEAPALAAGVLLFYCLFAGYFLLRPVRETMGVAGGVDRLQWLFTATFVVMLLVVPIYGAFAARVRRRRLVPWAYACFALQLLGFAAAFAARPDSVWLARGFYVWLSVFNLFVVSVAWSFLADVFDADQARRLFPAVAVGATLGALSGPLAGAALVRPLGHAGLLLLAAALLLASLAGVALLLRWRGARPVPEAQPSAQAMRGSALAGLTVLLRSPYLLGIGAFVVLLAAVNTFLYFEQARLVAETFPDRARQTQVFALLDALVQGLTVLVQLFLAGRIAARLGVTVLLTALPLAMAAGLLLLAAAPVFAVLAAIVVLRRVGEYALVRPGREMLFTVVDLQAKYKAKNLVDTAVYRGGDAVSAWLKTALDALGQGAAPAALAGAALALAWAGLGLALGRGYARRCGDTAGALPARGRAPG